MSKVRIPRAFFEDHRDRELPTPRIISETPRHFWIGTKDENLAELINDAKHYAGDGTDAPRYLVMAAQQLLRALGERV